jgi:hypothetical protein
VPVQISLPQASARNVFATDPRAGRILDDLATGSPPGRERMETRPPETSAGPVSTGPARERRGPTSRSSFLAGRLTLPDQATRNGRDSSDRRRLGENPPPAGIPLRPGPLWRLIRDYYRDPLAWVALFTFSIALTYIGGAVMFWFHAIYLQEGGPAIPPELHWALDSSAGFIGLTPILAVIMPLAASLSHTGELRLGRFAMITGGFFALATAPGPIFHDKFISRGTWVANHVTQLVGNGKLPTDHPHELPALLDMAGQVGVGLPTYVGLSALALVLVRVLMKRRAVATLAR